MKSDYIDNVSDEIYVVCPRCGFIAKFWVNNLMKYDKENPSKR
jgi:uncharacterized C2H2 Zn-finger protein